MRISSCTESRTQETSWALETACYSSTLRPAVEALSSSTSLTPRMTSACTIRPRSAPRLSSAHPRDGRCLALGCAGSVSEWASARHRHSGHAPSRATLARAGCTLRRVGPAHAHVPSGDRSCADLPRSAWSSLAHGSADDRKSRVRAAISASGLRHGLVSGARLPLVTDDIVAAARTFLDRDGRLIERRLAAVLFDDAPVSGVVDAVRAYRNPDGGFGHGLEPDKRCPASLPIDVERALDILLVATGDGGEDGPGNLDLSGLVEDACDWLASVAAPDGAVSLALPVMERYPRAEHWADWTYVPGLNPTAGLAGRLHQTGVTHPWLDRRSPRCAQRPASGATRGVPRFGSRCGGASTPDDGVPLRSFGTRRRRGRTTPDGARNPREPNGTLPLWRLLSQPRLPPAPALSVDATGARPCQGETRALRRPKPHGRTRPGRRLGRLQPR